MGGCPLSVPVDPFPDLTLITLPGSVIVNGRGELVQLVPERVVAAEVVERRPDGGPMLVRVL